jgi:putative peptidoglycan lipid II flippase
MSAPDTKSPRHWVLSAGKLSIGTTLSRVLGVVRDSMQAYLFGTGIAADAFTVAFRLPNMLRGLFAEGALSAAFVPVLTEAMEKGEQDEWKRFVLNCASVLAIVLAIVSLIGVLIAPYLIPVMAAGFGKVPGKTQLTIELTQVLFPYLLLIGLATLAMATLNALHRFTTPALAAVVMNLGMIGAMLVICPRLGPNPERAIFGLATGVMIGGLLQFAIQVPPLLKQGVVTRFRVSLHDPRLRHMGALMIPGVIGMGVAEINAFVDTLLATLLAPGSVAALQYGHRVMQLPLGVFAVALGTAVLPTMSRHAARRENAELERTFRLAWRLALYILLPTTGLFLVAHRPLLQLLFERGAFAGGHSLDMTASAFIFYTSGLCFYGTVKVVVPVFYARQNTRTPVRTGITAMVANIVFILILMRPLKLGGLALATALASALNVALLLRGLNRQYGIRLGSDVTRAAGRMLVASLIASGLAYLAMRGAAALPLAQSLPHGLLPLIAAGAVGAITYVGITYALRSEELAFLRGLLSRRSAAGKGGGTGAGA